MRWMIGVVLVLLSVTAQAGSERLLQQVYLLTADLHMFSYDEDNPEYQQAFADRIGMLTPMMDDWVAAHPDHVFAWSEARELLSGEVSGFGLVDGYDTAMAAQFGEYNRELRDALEAEVANQPLTDAARLWIGLSQALSNYMAVAAAPFGSFAMSANDDDAMMKQQVLELDELWQQLRESGQAGVLGKDDIERLFAKWRFIRGSLLDATHKAYPYIVRYNATAILEQLEQALPAEDAAS